MINPNQFMINPDQIRKYTYDPSDAMQVRGAKAFDKQIDEFIKNGHRQIGDRLPWDKTKDIRFRESEVTIWTGYNGSYKSMILGQVCLGFISQGKTVCIASPEMPPVTTLMRMLSQFAGSGNFVTEAKEKFYEFTKEKLYLYDQPKGIHAESLLGVIEFTRDTLAVDHFVIDSLMKLGVNGDDYNKQKWLVDNLCTIAKDTGVHIHLVAHQKKPQTGKHEVSRYDIAGSGDISNLVDNVIICYKSKNDDVTYTNGISVDKQRHYAGGVNPEPKYVFWMDNESLQFCENENKTILTPKIWMNKG